MYMHAINMYMNDDVMMMSPLPTQLQQAECSSAVRALCLGEDRLSRRYWRLQVRQCSIPAAPTEGGLE